MATRMSLPHARPAALRADGHAADDAVDLDRRAAGEGAQVDGDLVDQFAGRREDQRLDGLGLRVATDFQQVMDQRQAERCGLAGAGLGKAHDIAAR